MKLGHFDTHGVKLTSTKSKFFMGKKCEVQISQKSKVELLKDSYKFFNHI